MAFRRRSRTWVRSIPGLLAAILGFGFFAVVPGSGADTFGGGHDYSGQDLSGLDFSGVDLFGADFSDADLTDASFLGANLVAVDFAGANLTRVEFRLADLAVHTDLLATARDDVKLLLNKEPDLDGKRGAALRMLLYLFERDAAVAFLRSG